MNNKEFKNASKILKRVCDRSNKRDPVSFECRVRHNADKSKVIKTEKPEYAAFMKFPEGVESRKLILKSGLYFLDDKNKKGSKTGHSVYKEEDGIFVWNPSRKPLLPVIGVVMAMGNTSKLRNKIIIFKRKRRKPEKKNNNKTVTKIKPKNKK